MREEKPKAPSQIQKKTKMQSKKWFWPVIYSSIAILFVSMIWGYNVLMKDDTLDAKNADKVDPGAIVETNASRETLKFPFAEGLLDEVVILQDYYDMEADSETRENALLVFNQSYATNTGLSISVDGKPFQVTAAMSGVVEEIILDSFSGDEIIISHTDGLKTVYGSVSGILVQKGDEVIQGQPLAMTAQNDWNPKAGVHLHFEVIKDGVNVNPRNYLAF